MDSQPQQRFCVNCGQPLTPGAVFCGACGAQIGVPPAGTQGQFPVGAQQVYQQPYAQAPMQAQDEPLLTGLAGPFIGLALTTGLPHQIFTYVAVGMVVIFLALVFLAMLATRRGREALSEGCMEGCLDAILGGIFGGG